MKEEVEISSKLEHAEKSEPGGCGGHCKLEVTIDIHSKNTSRVRSAASARWIKISFAVRRAATSS